MSQKQPNNPKNQTSSKKLTLMLILLPIIVIVVMMVFWHLFQLTRDHNASIDELSISAVDDMNDWQKLYDENIHWLGKNLNDCPADLMPAFSLENLYTEGACDVQMSKCLAACQRGDAESCFNLGVEIQILEDPAQDDFSESLFQQACMLGSALACTNRAAGLSYSGWSGSNECAVRTYQKTCLANDVWGCSMLGFHYAKGIGIEQDTTQAKQFLIKACDIDPDTEACDNAIELLDQIEKTVTNTLSD